GPADQQASDRRVPRHLLIPGEVHRAGPVDERGEHRDVGVAALLLERVLLGALALLRHQPPEALLVHRQALLAGHLQREVDGEAIGVVQLERLLTGDAAGAAALDLADGGVKDRRPGAQRRNEGGLLGVDHALDAGPIPVSMLRDGSSPATSKSSLARTALSTSCMKTRFQTSR